MTADCCVKARFELAQQPGAQVEGKERDPGDVECNAGLRSWRRDR
jgi:hypothetical protein